MMDVVKFNDFLFEDFVNLVLDREDYKFFLKECFVILQ